MRVYFVRHGESEGNRKRVHQTPDMPLSKEGKKQAKNLAKRLKNKEINVIYSSPYIRAKQTSEIIAKELNLPIEYWDKLRERNRPSNTQGLPLDDPLALKVDKILSENFHKPDFRYSDEETFNELTKRAKKVQKHLLKNHKEQNILCVTHGGIMKVIVLSMILEEKLTPELFWQFYFHSWNANTGITEVIYKKRGWVLLTLNDVTHL